MVHLTELHARVTSNIRQRHLLTTQQRLLVAVSGGQDSLCLLQILQDLAPRWQWQLHVLHCDHRWTPDETRCAHFLQQWFQTQQITFAIETVPEITLDENRARQWRYSVLGQWARTWNCSTILTAHTGTDRAETFLFNLLRGSGPQGLASLDWIRPLNMQDPSSPDLVRPLLNVWRWETADFCHVYSLPVWPDLTNQDLTHRRNRIRLELMPYLKDHFNPRVEAALTRTATLLMAEHDFVHQSATQLVREIYEDPPPRLHRVRLRQDPLALQRQVIFMVLGYHLPSAVQFEQVEMVHRLLNAPHRSRTPPFPGGGWAEVVKEWIYLRNFPSQTGTLVAGS